MSPDKPPRITEGERDTAVDRLKEAFAEGHISPEEMDERLHVALSAMTQAELTSALATLPDKDAGRTVVIDAINGRIKRSGGWRVPRVLKVDSTYGKVDLDLSHAVLESQAVDIELRLQYGWARIRVPRDATVDYEGLRADWKQPVYKAPRHGGQGRPHIRILGTMEYGRLTIKHSRHRQKL
jgi:Domain of unknown function (DUF1707)